MVKDAAGQQRGRIRTCRERSLQSAAGLARACVHQVAANICFALGPLTMAHDASVTEWLEWLQQDLYTRVLPFWMQHSLDEAHGGFFKCVHLPAACRPTLLITLRSCLDVDGKRYDSKKYVWLQGRQVWMLAAVAAERSAEDIQRLSGGKLQRDAMIRAAEAGARGCRQLCVQARSCA